MAEMRARPSWATTKVMVMMGCRRNWQLLRKRMKLCRLKVGKRVGDILVYYSSSRGVWLIWGGGGGMFGSR